MHDFILYITKVLSSNGVVSDGFPNAMMQVFLEDLAKSFIIMTHSGGLFTSLQGIFVSLPIFTLLVLQHFPVSSILLSL